MPLRIGAKLPHTGPVEPASVPDRARVLEAAGFDSLWVSDHVVFPEMITSRYPFAPDGRATWPSELPWLEAVTTLAAAAAVTSRVRLGTAVLVAPQRNPILLAKQIASVAALSDGRVTLGVGAGWLREEFEALDAPFRHRGARLDEWIGLLRECWTGRPAPHDGPGYRLPAGTLMLPPPPRPVPILVGGHSPTALRRAGERGRLAGPAGGARLDPHRLRTEIDIVRAAATAGGRRAQDVDVVLRLVGSAGQQRAIAGHLADLVACGVGEIVVDVGPGDDPGSVHELLRAAAGSPPAAASAPGSP